MIKRLLIVLPLFLCIICPAYGWDDKKTHRDITEVAIEKSNLIVFLKNNLGIKENLERTYGNKSIIELLRDGSENEDIPYRAYNHFWNPIHNEGLDDEGWGWVFGNNFWLMLPMYWHFTGLPNRYWAMGQAQDGTSLDECGPGDHSNNNDCNDYSWRRSRDTYYEALTSVTESDRNQKFMEFYEKL